ncbi:MAG TPA: hypothetical protein H9979_00845 [Candidatus Megamonas gallistercoris]|nr:hypothetical protein [Candidatus Megamonas gallistercoris]
MSYASGMAIGLTIGQQLLKFFAQDNQEKKNNNSSVFNFEQLDKELNYINRKIETHTICLAHAIKGRRRYYIDMLKNNEKLAKLISVKLSELPFVKEVTTNINTGSLLILYSCTENIMDDIFTQLKQRVFSIGSRVITSSSDITTQIGCILLNLIREINMWIKAKTGNLMDLRIAVAALFIIRGLRKVMTMGQRPSGPQMLWWAFSILRGLGK